MEWVVASLCSLCLGQMQPRGFDRLDTRPHCWISDLNPPGKGRRPYMVE